MWALLTALITALALTACPADDDGPADPDAPEEEEEEAAGSIEVWIMQPGTEAVEDIVRGQVEEFEEETGAQVDLQFVPWPAAHDQFVTGIAGDRVPDVAEMGTTWTPEFGEMGALAPVETADQDFVESLVESGTIEDETLGAPWYAGARSLIYRADIFEELGLEPPETWDDVIAAGETIEEETDLFPFGVIGAYTHLYLPMIWNWGGDIAEEADGQWESRVDSPEAVEAWSFYQDMFDRGWAPEGALGWNSADLREAFAAGDFAMMVGGGWDLAAIIGSNPDLEGNVEAVLTPEGPDGNRDAFAGGSHFVIFEGSEDSDLAQQLIDHMLDEERVAEFATEIGFLPGTESGIEASGLLDDELYSPFAEQLRDHSRTYPASGGWGTIEGEGVFEDAMERVLGGDSSPEEALTEVDARLDEVFAD